jgi:hypothetical protein
MHSSIKKLLLLLPFLLFLSACEDKAIVKIHNKKILDTKIECMNLLVFPPNEAIEKTLHSLYNFKQECPLTLHVSYKSAIVCNSTHNVSRKAVGMPSGYLRLELKEETQLFYSYYVDLDELLGDEQLEEGFSRLSRDILNP